MKAGDERFLRGLYDLKYLFGDKWAPATLVTLSGGPMRRKEILSTISSYSIGEGWSDKHAVLHDSILARTLKKMTEEGLLARIRCTKTFPVTVTYELKPEVLEFLPLTETLVAWADEHQELIAQAQAYSRRNGDEIGTRTGIAELDELGLTDDEDDK
jgi:DNA-binding HxlR family transcriptional regulator